MPKPRNIAEVIDRMLAVTPTGSTLRPRLEHLKRTASYKAPEQMPEMWAEGSLILAEELGPRSQIVGWQAEVAAIWMNTDGKFEVTSPTGARAF